MRTTTDLYTGKPFRWNDVVRIRDFDILTPARYTSRTATHLDPHRVPVKLLRELNPEWTPPVNWSGCQVGTLREGEDS